MILSISEQCKIFLFMVAIGASIGFFYDIFRIIRKTLPHPGFLIQIEDICFWCIASVGAFYFILNFNDGEVRGFSIAGIVIGMILYFLTISYIIISVCVTVLDFVKKVLIQVFKIIIFPIKIIWGIIMIPLKFLRNLLHKGKKPVKKLLQNSKSYAKIKKANFAKELKIIMKKV